MTMLDKLAEFADDVTVAAAAGTAVIGSQIDLGVIGLKPGVGEPVYLVLTTGSTEIITGGSAGTILFRLVSDSTAGLATDGSSTVHLTTATFVTDDAAANSAALNAGGVLLVASLPYGTYERYLGIICTIATTTVTAGTINAYLTKDPSAYIAYANAI